MSYNLSVSDYSSFIVPEMETIDYNLLFDLPYDSSSSSSDYNLQALLNNNGNQPQNPDQLHQNPTFHQTTQFQSPTSRPNLDEEYQNFDGLSSSEVKNEGSKLDSGSVYNDENVANLSSQNFQGQALSLPENNSFAGKMTNLFVNGDFENLLMGESPGFRVGRYSPEERQERISKYRAKRNRRNFNKTIKYACRKTLADNRPRIRGRFARNDETAEIPKAACSTRDEHGCQTGTLPGVGDETVAKGTFTNSFSLYQFPFNRHGCF